MNLPESVQSKKPSTEGRCMEREAQREIDYEGLQLLGAK